MARSFPVVKQYDSSTRIFNEQSTKQILALLTGPDIAEYAKEGMVEIFENLAKESPESAGKFKNLKEEIAKLARIMSSADKHFQSRDVFAGESPMTRFQAFHKGLEDEALDSTADVFANHDHASMLIKVDDNGTMMRAYSIDGQYLKQAVSQEAATIDNIDAIMKAWLAENNIFYKDGVLYESDANGEIQKNKDQPIKVSKQEFNRKLHDPENGLASYCKERGLNMTSIVDAGEKPAQKVAQPISKDVPPTPAAVQATEVKPTKPEADEEVTPKTPGSLQS